MKREGPLGLAELIAIGVGGMIGGWIFSVLGLAVGITGHAAPLSFALGSGIALASGYSYVRLALTYRADGASFTYLQRAFPRYPSIPGIAGWTVIVGYIGTLALYAFTFGAYGSDLVGSAGSTAVRLILSAGVMLVFMAVNLLGAQTSGRVEDLVVYTKIILLGLFGVAGLLTVRADRMIPVFDQGVPSVFMAGALIFVAYEGFQLITNTVEETRDPERNVPLGIYGSILITSVIYIVLAVVAVGNLTPAEISFAQEYALAKVAEPVLGNAGRLLVGLAALLATSSAINGTVLGASHLMAEMGREGMAPAMLAQRNRNGVPWLGVLTMTGLGLVFTLLSGLRAIAAFSSMTFLLVSIAVSVANLRLRKATGARVPWVLCGLGLMSITVTLLVRYLWQTDRETLLLIGGLYLVVGVSERLYWLYKGEQRRA